MNLSEFINNVETKELPDEWEVSFNLPDNTIGKVFVKEAYNSFEAQEQAFNYLNKRIYVDRN